MFVDIAQIYVQAGKGGDGRVSFRREKYVPDGGPDGGDGGRGGNIVVTADSGLRTLMDFRYKRRYIADGGDHGSKKRCHGKDADNLRFRVPVGTIIRDEKTGKVIADLTEPNQVVVIAKGGTGGRGNQHFATSTRQAPTFAEQGRYGEEKNIVLELKLLADVGLLGYPNVGKSTLLAFTTKAKPKIANYHFTTITPNLGVVEVVRGKSFVMADIPGLIEGAAQGVGLGHEFLRHVERNKCLIHVVDVSGIEGRNPIEDFDRINNELKLYSEILSHRVQIVAANKSDLVFEENAHLLKEFKEEMESRGYKVFEISAATGLGVDDLMRYVTEALDTIEVPVIHKTEEIYEDDELEDVHKVINYYKDGNVFVADGIPLERLVYSTDFNDMGSSRRFQDILKSKGVFEKFKEMGIDDGDFCRICTHEFEYFN